MKTKRKKTKDTPRLPDSEIRNQKIEGRYDLRHTIVVECWNGQFKTAYTESGVQVLVVDHNPDKPATAGTFVEGIDGEAQHTANVNEIGTFKEEGMDRATKEAILQATGKL